MAAVRVRLFASLRERIGCEETVLEVAEGATVAELWERVAAGHELPERVLAAVNHDYCDGGRTLADGDEVAFFPPVTGG